MPESGFPKLGKCDISREKWGWTDGRCRNLAFQSLENAIFVQTSECSQMGGARMKLSEAWKMRNFSRKVGVDRWSVPKSGFPKLGKCFISRENKGGQMGGAKIWLPEACADFFYID